jgi:hypothetical protein
MALNWKKHFLLSFVISVMDIPVLKQVIFKADEHMSVIVAYVVTGICTHCSCYLRRLDFMGCTERTILLNFKLY